MQTPSLPPRDRAFVLNHANEDPVRIAAAIHSNPVTVKHVIRSHVTGRLLQKVSVTSEGCWKWLGAVNSGGCAVVWFEGNMMSAAKVAYRLRYGTMPRRIRRTCGTHLCVNPDHLVMEDSAK